MSSTDSSTVEAEFYLHLFIVAAFLANTFSFQSTHDIFALNMHLFIHSAHFVLWKVFSSTLLHLADSGSALGLKTPASITVRCTKSLTGSLGESLAHGAHLTKPPESL